ncbi:restriction endonuclease [Phaeobacter sp. JL2872]|nr:restriction endonuclease [Phaeobacter sp. JL2872]
MSAPELDINITLADVEILADAIFSKNAHAGLYVAQCGGFPIGTLDTSRFSEYWTLVLQGDPSTFVEADKLNAARYRVKEFLGQISGVHGLKLIPDHSQRERVIEIGNAARKGLISERSFEKLGIVNVADTILNVAMRKKHNDLERIALELGKREDYLRSTFLPLQRSRVNKYGDVDLSDEVNEIDGFIDYVFDRTDFDYFYTVSPAAILVHYIDEKLSDFKVEDDIPLDGIAFEHWCANQIESQGWNVSVSKASGDQGVDVIAERDGKRVAVQCKRYSNPIGNKAVQEAFTGAQNVDASDSCVMGTGGFTASAKEIAAKTGVHLIDASNVKSFSGLFGFEVVSNEQSESEDDFEEALHTLCFDGSGGGFSGTLLRSMIQTSGPEMYRISAATGREILDKLDEGSGRGEIVVERATVSLLLFLVAQGLKSSVSVAEENVAAMLNSAYYDPAAVEKFKGAEALIEDVVKSDVLKEVYSFLFKTSKSLGPLYNDMLQAEISKILFSQSLIE